MAEPASEAAVASVRERLDQALVTYLATLQADDIAEVNVEQIAQLAEVSRATAYRHFGDQQGLLYEAATRVARHHADVCKSKIARAATVAATLQEAFSYTAYAMRTDPMLRMLMTSRRSPAIAAAIGALGLELLGPAIRGGQLNGQVRTDLSPEEVMSWISEMQFVVIRLDLDEDAARSWVRTYMLPTLNPLGHDPDLLAQVDAVLTDVEQRVDALSHSLTQARTPLTNAKVPSVD
ncbi:TetR/AcrR family transcriptional regulator [Jatrophihabitans sp. DSM 45814]